MAVHTLLADLPGCWDGSEAQPLLNKDILEPGCHTDGCKGEMLWLKRSKHQESVLCLQAE